jgi:hypothetical protein
MNQQDTQLLFTLDEGKNNQPSLAMAKLKNDIASIEHEEILKKYQNRNKGTQTSSKKKETPYDPKKKQFGVLYPTKEVLKKKIEAERAKLSPKELDDLQSGIDNIGYGDIFYAPQQNNISPYDWKIRPMIVFPVSFTCTTDANRIYAVPLTGDHSEVQNAKDEESEENKKGKRKNRLWYKKLNSPIDEPNEEGYHALTSEFYANIGVFRHTIIEGKPLYSVERSDIIRVGSHASEDTLDLIFQGQQEIEEENKSIIEAIRKAIDRCKQSKRTIENSSLYNDLWVCQFFWKLSDDVFIKKVLDVVDKHSNIFKVIKFKYLSWKKEKEKN